MHEVGVRIININTHFFILKCCCEYYMLDSYFFYLQYLCLMLGGAIPDKYDSLVGLRHPVISRLALLSSESSL